MEDFIILIFFAALVFLLRRFIVAMCWLHLAQLVSISMRIYTYPNGAQMRQQIPIKQLSAHARQKE